MKNTQGQLMFGVADRDSRRRLVSPHNKNFQLNKFVGNKEAVRRLSRAVFCAYGKQDRDCSEYSFALCGPASTGKTYLAKLFADSLKIPFVVIEPQSIKKVKDIFEEIRKACDRPGYAHDISLVEHDLNKYYPPPMIVFIDEVHNLKKSVVHGLLKATEPNDRIMMTEDGDEVDTRRICWMIATTERGELFDAFDTRFQKINLRLYSRDEMAHIIKMNNPDWSKEICQIVAKYNSQVPREALAFARDMRVEHEMSGGSWEEVAMTVARDHEIDSYGMTFKRIEVLKALGQSPISSSQLPFVIHVKEEELKRFIMPPLMSRTPDQEPVVTVSSRGYSITLAGLEELELRSIPHRGFDAMPEQVRQLYLMKEVV